MKSKKKIVSAFVHESWNKHNTKIDEIYECFSDKIITRALIGKKIGIPYLKEVAEEWFFSFPDFVLYDINIEEHKNIVMLNGKVSGHYVKRYEKKSNDDYSNSNILPFFKKISEINPNGNKITYPVEGHFVFEDKKIVFCDFSGVDLIDFFQQLGCSLKEHEYPSQHIFYLSLKELSKELRNSANPPLSPKEIECLCLSLNGFSAKQIGSLMSISYRTVQTHIQHSFDKLQCYNKYQCLEMMYENGFLPIWRDLFNLLIKRYPSFR